MSKSEGEARAVIQGGNTKVALYRKYRPTSLDQVVGQPQVTDVLAAAAKTGSFAHAYLFTGQRGTGKTTVARILAHLINHLDYSDNINSDNIDIIEIDAASNNGVDDVRAIRDSVQLAPMHCSHKVYIIDEFHMLSKPAFNALLKTIEEPPEYVVFILATTELQRVPATILSRVQRFHFKPLPPALLAKHLRMIADQEGINIDDDALLLIAERGGGSVRDSITLLDQLSNNVHITVDTVNEVLGLVSNEIVDQLVAATIDGQSQQIIRQVRQIIDDGTSPVALAEQLVKRLENKATEQPALYDLIGRLLETSKSALPEAKLLSVLVCYRLPMAAPINAPKTATVLSPSSGQAMADAMAADNNQAAPSADEAAVTGQQTKTASPSQSIDDFNWNDLLQQLADDDCPSTRSLLEQADYRYNSDSNTLVLFFGRAFYRKQAHGSAFSDELLAALDKLYHCQPVIDISNDKAPVDSDVAAVLSVVGGEVTKINDGEI